MESRIPLPTDNIYKFYALFGLLLAIFASGALLYVNQSTNNLIYEIAVEYEVLKHIPENARIIPEAVRFEVLNNKREIAKKDKAFFFICISVIMTIATCMVWYGFSRWQRVIQPMQDEITCLNIKKLKQDVGEIRNTPSGKVFEFKKSSTHSR